MKIKRKIKGYTLIELLVVTGVLSLAAIGIYTVAGVASDWRKSSQEVRSLNMAIKEIDNSTVTAGTYTGITLSSLNNVSSGINSSLQLRDVVSPDANKLNFVYSNLSPRICSDFASKMLSSSNNIGAIINGKEINTPNLGEVVSACETTGGLSDVTIVLNKTQNANTIDTVVASVNPPAAPTPDIVIPTFGGPTALPSVPGFVPSTASPVTYPLTTGTPPSFGPVVGGGGPISVTTPSSPITPSNPSVSTWTPPYVYIPPATPAPLDALDQDPNPPAPPPPPPPPPAPTYYAKYIPICQTGYTFENSPISCSANIPDASRPQILISFQLPSSAATKGTITIHRTASTSNLMCNSGEAGEGFGYHRVYPQEQDQDSFYNSGLNYRGNTDIKTYNNINFFISACYQTG